MNNELNFYLPNLEENSSQTYSLVMKDKNVDNLESNILSDKNGTLDEIMKQYNDLKSKNANTDFFIITEQTAKSISNNDNLSHNDWVKVINETYAKLGIQNDPLLTNEQLIEQKTKIESPSISKEKLLNPGIKAILTPEDIEDKPKTVPTPEQINNNYLPISHQFQHIKENQLEAKMRKSPLSTSMVATTIGLLGVGMLSIPLAPIALPAAFLVGTAALIKSALFKGNKAEVKQWEKRKELLTAAALDSLGATVNGKKIPKLDDMQAIENILFTPDIEKKYKELCRKISLPPSLNEKISNFRQYGNNKKTYGLK